MPSIHFDFPKRKVFIRKEYLYDMSIPQGQYLNAELIGVSSYPGHVLTFNALVEGKFLFHYLPLMAFTSKPSKSKSLHDSYYFNCPSGDLVMTKLLGLNECTAFSKQKQFIGIGNYQLTFDWYNENNLSHLIELEDGNFVLAPSHKVIFNAQSSDALPDYKKLHSTWKL